jgi:hypothetical protein
LRIGAAALEDMAEELEDDSEEPLRIPKGIVSGHGVSLFTSILGCFK